MHPDVKARLLKDSPFLQSLKPSEQERWINTATRLDATFNLLRYRKSEPLAGK
jgi:hypothetical protein